MSIKIALHHKTHYTYDRPAQLGPQTIRLRPAPHTRGHIISYSLKVFPEKHFSNWQQDPFGNHLARFVFPEKTKEFKVEVDLVADIKVFNPFDFFLEDHAQKIPLEYSKEQQTELKPYLEVFEQDPLLMSFVEEIRPAQPEPTVDYLVKVNALINQRMKYLIRMEPGVQSCEKTLQTMSGSCRDLSWLFCQALRHLGLATRFTSGYLVQLKADVKSLEGPSGPSEDFTDLHAWTEVFLPGAGWVGLDPTSGLFAGEGHLPLCSTPSPLSAAPVSGVLEPCESSLKHEMTVQRIHEEARVTKPFSESDWNRIDELGQSVDESLKKNDVRLTMGGEPTFVSLDDPDGDEWNFTALSEKKELLAEELLLKLEKRFSNGALIHFGQGKWYPGEILPRWSKNCFWRKDREPIWNNRKWLGHKNAIENNSSNVSPETAQIFTKELAQVLGLSVDAVQSAYEDALFYISKEQRLSLENEAYQGDLFEATERKRVQRLLNENISKATGYVLPLAFSVKRKSWLTCPWHFRSERLLLTPGDSPIGLRLPLSSLKAVKNEEVEDSDTSALAPAAPLASWQERRSQIENRIGKNKTTEMMDLPSGYVKTALCVEVREGKLFVFLPPTYRLESFLDLVQSIELAAERSGVPVYLEGYEPPFDLRLESLRVTPDPGVIEVNIQPTENWNDLKTVIESIYEDAKTTRLTTQKFLLDGRAVGTGGGNHVIVGGKSPEHSPFLRRPDLLKSFILFWQNHPSLSYLFSSQFIGPTSQSPRLDEARNDSLHELEIACQELDAHFDPKNTNSEKEPPLWLVDRLFRNILMDLTGNTHRSELCIDKLFSPDSERGRLGLLELRSFEMTPHPKMNLVQALLVRSLVDLFWKRPYEGDLIRWGNLLHDKFMLPHFVWQDFKDVLRCLNKQGHAFELNWFKPFFEFRFPKYGDMKLEGLDLELRMALEPWPVLGEEISQGATSRSVDSAVERVQLKVKGTLSERYVVTCNKRKIPLVATETRDEYIAGVRFKAWAPSSSLHPSIKAQGPLVFDVIDKAFERSIGGFTYHVAHPGGRNFKTLPVNANEAEGRRLARFSPSGHSIGKINHFLDERDPEFPYTLDLRKKPKC